MTEPLQVNGWTLYAHPLFLDQVEELIRQAEQARRNDPSGYVRKRCAKMLAAIAKLMFEDIPQDPSRVTYRQGSTLGAEYTHWCRAVFYQQYRLFFRYHTRERIILYAWVNDDNTKRAYQSRTDAYMVFRKMLDDGNPPNDWNVLKAECDKAAGTRLSGIVSNIGDFEK
jgi:toxin YhaV